MVILVSAADRPLADIICGLLADNGIRTEVRADDSAGLYPSMAIGRVRILVDEADLGDAQALLAAAEAGQLQTPDEHAPDDSQTRGE